MLAKDLIKILRKERKATVVIKINGISFPIEDIFFTYTSDGDSFIEIEPRDITKHSN